MVEPFLHESTGVRVLFGVGRIGDAAAEADRLGRCPLLISDPSFLSVAQAVGESLEGEVAGLIDEVPQHVPAEAAEAARARARAGEADSLVAVGGGSAIGLAKSVALTEELPILAVPTTYAGSETTPVWGITEAGVKTTGRDQAVAPRTIVYDPELTLSMPPRLTAASGLNALAHCVDALWAGGRTPLTDTFAEHGIAELVRTLSAAVEDGSDLDARSGALVGAWLAGTSFAVAGGSLHHRLCHAIGGRFDLPHAETHAVVLPWVTGLLAPQVPSAAAVLERVLGPDPADALRGLLVALGLPTRLDQLGLSEEQALELSGSLDPDALRTPILVSREDLDRVLVRATVGDG